MVTEIATGRELYREAAKLKFGETVAALLDQLI